MNRPDDTFNARAREVELRLHDPDCGSEAIEYVIGRILIAVILYLYEVRCIESGVGIIPEDTA